MEIAVISGKGGTGKSSISAAFATLGQKVVVADCDVDAANLYLLFNPVHESEEVYISGFKAAIDYSRCKNCGLCTRFCRFDAITFINREVSISETACDGCFLCSRICPEEAISMIPEDKSRMYSGSFRNGKMVYGRLSPGEENSGKLVTLVREKAKQSAKANGLNTIILDGPPGIGCPVIATIAGVDKVVVVTEPTLSGLFDMQRVIELGQKPGREIFAIINKYDLNPEVSRQIEKWCCEMGVILLGKLPFDPNVVEAMVHGKTVVEWAPDSVVSKKIGQIREQILKT